MPARSRCGRGATSAGGTRTSPTCAWSSRAGPTRSCTSAGWTRARSGGSTVVGEQKMAVYDDMSDNERIRIYDIGVDPADIDDPHLAHAMPVSYRTGDIVSPFVAFQEPLLVQDRTSWTASAPDAARPRPGERGLEIVRVLAATDVAAGHRAVRAPVRSRCRRRPARAARRSLVTTRERRASRSSISSRLHGELRDALERAWTPVLAHGRFVGGPGGGGVRARVRRLLRGRARASASATAPTRWSWCSPGWASGRATR